MKEALSVQAYLKAALHDKQFMMGNGFKMPPGFHQ